MLSERILSITKLTGRAVILLTAASVLFLSGCAPVNRQQYIDDGAYVDDVEYLSRYGEWIDYEPYGPVWLPYVVSGWEPFRYGHWIWTDDGWAWTSYEPYGWLVYHYGYWGYETGLGWFWVPEDVWYPARVQWYTFDNFVAWAPFPPPGIMWPAPWDPYNVDVWLVVDIDDFTREGIERHIINRRDYGEKVEHRTAVKRPPDHKQVEDITRRDVPTIMIREQDTRVQPRTDPSSSTTTERREQILKKMVLPRAERRKVEKHAPKVEREVLKPRKEPAEERKSSREREGSDKRESSEEQRSTEERKSSDEGSRETRRTR